MSVKDIAIQKPVTLRPFYEFPRIMDWFDDMSPMNFSLRSGLTHPIKIEEWVKDDEMVVRAELPGVDPEKDIEVTVGEGFLTIKGERRETHKEAERSEFHYGSFSRTLVLPHGVDEKSVHAVYEDGILEVKVKFPPASNKVKKVFINRAK